MAPVTISNENKCVFCEAIFEKGSGLNAHLLEHTKEARFRCGNCRSVNFGSLKELEVHLMKEHGNGRGKCGRVKACGWCNGCFWEGELREHWRRRECWKVGKESLGSAKDEKVEVPLKTKKPVIKKQCDLDLDRGVEEREIGRSFEVTEEDIVQCPRQNGDDEDAVKESCDKEMEETSKEVSSEVKSNGFSKEQICPSLESEVVPIMTGLEACATESEEDDESVKKGTIFRQDIPEKSDKPPSEGVTPSSQSEQNSLAKILEDLYSLPRSTSFSSSPSPLSNQNNPSVVPKNPAKNSHYPMLVLMDPETKTVTPFPTATTETTNDSPSALNQLPEHPPNLFFSVNGEVVMPAFSIPFLHFLARKNRQPSQANTVSSKVYEPDQETTLTYKCTFCSKSSSDRYNLFLHLRTHTGEKPYSCPVCNSHFNRKGNMVQHIIRVHGRSKLPVKKAGNSTNGSFTCPLCRGSESGSKKQFASKKPLSQHIFQAHPEIFMEYPD